jgi:rubrerythrin
MLGLILMAACNNSNTRNTEQTTEQALVYECPMKCEGKTFDKPGKCPVCGMDLEKVENKNDGHKH